MYVWRRTREPLCACCVELPAARRYGNKPVYAYEWLRYHDSNKKLAGQELAPYLVEAMAVVPYFCGAKGIVHFGGDGDACVCAFDKVTGQERRWLRRSWMAASSLTGSIGCHWSGRGSFTRTALVPKGFSIGGG